MAHIEVPDDVHRVLVEHCEDKGITVDEWATRLLAAAATTAKVGHRGRLERLSNVAYYKIWHRPPFWARP